VADLTELLLPSGARVRGHLPTLGTLLRRKLLPTDLLAIALKAANPAWLTAARAFDPEDGAQAQAYLAVLVAAFPRERCEPGSDAWQPWRITPDDLVNDAVDELDIDALENVVLRIISPEECTAASRSLLGIAEPGDEEVAAGIAGWEEFRGEPGSGTAGPDGEPLEPAPEWDAGPVGSGHRLRPGRGARDGGDDRGAVGDEREAEGSAAR
jgi:hypothetical protein